MSKKHSVKRISQYVWGSWWERLATITIVFVLLFVGSGIAFATVYQDKIFPGVAVGSFPLGGLTEAEAGDTVLASFDFVEENGLRFVFRDRTVTVPTVVTATDDPDLSYEVISYNAEDTVREAYAYGRSGSFVKQWSERIASIIGSVSFSPHVEWRQEAVVDILKRNFSEFENPARDAQLVVSQRTVRVEPERDGIVFDYQDALVASEQQLQKLIFSPIPLKLRKNKSVMKTEDVEPLIPEAQAFVARGPLTVRYESFVWYLTRTQLSALLEAQRTDSGGVVLGFGKEKFNELLAPIAQAVAIEPQEARFKIEDERVVEFKASADGRKLDSEETLRQWHDRLLDEDVKDIEPIVVVVQPQQDLGKVNDLGIVELLGVGTSSFARSPQNRRHNIRVGAESVNGTLVPPGEEFSLLETLGTIDKTTGYLPELVIKGNKTIPEYGGGLCQIGTTTFRGTLKAGLPVIARRNHSYSVPYYFDEYGLPGTDATIYDPAPDYRFKNDTGNHVLIVTRIEGDNLFFEFWGTKDGRTIEQSKTRVWDRVPPPPTKYVETLDLPIGETKCTESPHDGIKAAFDYTITYADGTIAEETFSSQYRPWQEVCLIGVETLSEETVGDIEPAPDELAPPISQ